MESEDRIHSVAIESLFFFHCLLSVFLIIRNASLHTLGSKTLLFDIGNILMVVIFNNKEFSCLHI